MGSSVRSSAAVKRIGAGLGVLAACAAAGPPAAGAALPDGRAYELVSAQDDNLGDVTRVVTAGDDADSLVYVTQAADDQAPGVPLYNYLRGQRTGGGWGSVSLNPALGPTSAPNGAVSAQAIAFSTDLRAQLADTPLNLGPGDTNAASDYYVIASPQGTSRFLTPGGPYDPFTSGRGYALIGVSADLSRVLFRSSAYGGAPQLVPGDPDDSLYLWADGVLTNVGVANGQVVSTGQGMTPANARSGLDPNTPAGGLAAPYGGANSLSADGSRLYYVTRVPGDNVNFGVYVRDHGAVKRIAEHGEFLAATADGSVAYLLSDRQLTPDATPGGGIFRYELATDTLEQITPDAGGLLEAGVDAAQLAANGSRLYFVARAALAPGAVDGDSNVYVWDGQQVRFITTVASPAALVRVSRNGRYLLLRTTASLDGAPNNGRDAVYVYDDVAQTLECASCRPDGGPSQGDALLLDGEPAVLMENYIRSRNVADDGTVVFQTDEALVDADENAVADVYRYRAGDLALVSTGKSQHPSRVGDVSDDGRTVLFITRDSLTGHDVDSGLWDVYAARVGGGHPEPVPPAAGCQGDGCKGAWPGGVTAPPIASGVPSAGNVTPVARPPLPPERDEEEAPSVRQTVRLSMGDTARDRLRAGKGASVVARVTGGGTLRLGGSIEIGDRSLELDPQRKRVRSTDAVRLRLGLRLPRAARRALADGDRVELRLEAQLGDGEPEQITITLTPARR
ncbi:MAG TPA: hypothetical protein VIL49_09945 [Capillimicrobium sp.]|jgi:hypothetical protein